MRLHAHFGNGGAKAQGIRRSLGERRWFWQPAISGEGLGRVGTSEQSRVRGKGPSRSGSRVGSEAGQAIDYKGELFLIRSSILHLHQHSLYFSCTLPHPLHHTVALDSGSKAWYIRRQRSRFRDLAPTPTCCLPALRRHA